MRKWTEFPKAERTALVKALRMQFASHIEQMSANHAEDGWDDAASEQARSTWRAICAYLDEAP